MFNIAAVIVTNNRLELLQEAIMAVKNQSVALSHIIVINNGSTDGTTEWLGTQAGILVQHQKNSGGSGGFFTGIKTAMDLNVDLIWLMDDDTICRENALEVLVSKFAVIDEPIGFISSKAVWKDNTPHLMNLPAIKPSFNNKLQFNKYDHERLLLVETSSFVSLLVTAEAVKKVGLPYKEFFIWGDDQEYTRRITQSGFLGLYSSESVVLHKTGINYFPDFYRDTVSNLWKHNYGFRNEFFMIKKNKGFLYFMCWLPAKIAYTSYKLIRIRKENHFKFISILFNSAVRSISFNPKIVKV